MGSLHTNILITPRRLTQLPQQTEGLRLAVASGRFCQIKVFPSFTLTSFISFLNEKMSPVPPVYLDSLINGKHSPVAGGAEDVLAGREVSFRGRNAHIPSGMPSHPSLSVDWPSQRVLDPFYWCLRCASPEAPGGHAGLIESKLERLLLLARAHKHKP